MTDRKEGLEALAEAAYNGVCLAAENGETAAYEAAQVTAPKEMLADLRKFTVPLPNGDVGFVIVGILPGGSIDLL